MYNGQGHGIYWYNKLGINWRAYASFTIAVAPLLPGFSKSINSNLDVGGIWKIYTFSCLYGFVTSGLTYYVICSYISGVGSAKIDEAVYPPGRRDSSDVESGVPPSDDGTMEKQDVAVSVGEKL